LLPLEKFYGSNTGGWVAMWWWVWCGVKVALGGCGGGVGCVGHEVLGEKQLGLLGRGKVNLLTLKGNIKNIRTTPSKKLGALSNCLQPCIYMGWLKTGSWLTAKMCQELLGAPNKIAGVPNKFL